MLYFLWFGRIRFGTISAWMNVSLKCHVKGVQKEKATIGRWAVVSYWIFISIFTNIHLTYTCRLILFDFSIIWMKKMHITRRCLKMVISDDAVEWNVHTIAHRLHTFHDYTIRRTIQTTLQLLECTPIHHIAIAIQIQRKWNSVFVIRKIDDDFSIIFIWFIYSLTSQWLNTSSMNAYQSCPSRNSFGHSTQIPSAVQSINSFPSLSNNIGSSIQSI